LPNKANKCFIINRSSEKLKWLLRQESARTAILGGSKIKDKDKDKDDACRRWRALAGLLPAA
jgi:hypothetical protein